MNTVETRAKTKKLLTRTLRVSGCVQGVGFRPFVQRLASSLKLRGSVSNQNGNVLIRIQGADENVQRFVHSLGTRAPRNANIQSVELIEDARIDAFNNPFSIEPSNASAADSNGDQRTSAAFPVDYALCDACLTEMRDPANRRFGYPFTSCTECGPRFTITKALPFDRAQTTLNSFPLCDDCLDEYNDPNDRRFHAEILSCPRCGPALTLLNNSGERLQINEPYSALLDALSTGDIVAIKSTGGIHLCCDALNQSAVAKLRAIKHRPDKPLVMMGEDFSSFSSWLRTETSDQVIFNDPRAPIVLIAKNSTGQQELEHLAPNCRDLGVMRPYNGIYRSLFDEAKKTQGTKLLIAVTSANLSGAPIITTMNECVSAFKNNVAYFLDHNLDIVNACDDSVIQGGTAPLLFRLGRGYAPLLISGFETTQHIVAFGAHEKSTVSVSEGSRVWLSPEIGKLNCADSCRRFDLQRTQFYTIAGNKPDLLTCDLHPDYRSSHMAEELSKAEHLRLVRVAHHHAHIAAVLLEHGQIEPCIGLALDGFGLGPENEAWGGELLMVNGSKMKRLGHITPMRLAGGDAASRNPLRCAHSVLGLLSSENAKKRRVSLNIDAHWDALLNNPNCSKTTSMGRWFDAIAALLGFDKKMSYEAEAAIFLEALASKTKTMPSAQQIVTIDSNELNLLPLLELILVQTDNTLAAWIFHVELADGFCRWLIAAQEQTGFSTAVASGGCIQNRILRELLSQNAREAGIKLLLPTKTPTNDASISLGQLYVASLSSPAGEA